MDNVQSRIISIGHDQQIEVLRKFMNEEGAEKRQLLVSSFMFLAADIIKSDGEIKLIEIQCVQDLLREILCEDEVKDAFTVLQKSLNTKVTSYELNWQDDLISHCETLKETVPEEVQLHILAFLHDIIKIDGVVDACEMISLKGIAQLMGISFDDE